MKLRLILSLLLLSIAPAFAESGPHHIAVIDVNQVLEESDAGKAIFARLKAAQSERVARIGKLEQEVRKLEMEVVTGRASLTEAQLAERNRQATDKRAALERLTKDAEQELGEMRDRELQGLVAKIEPIVEAVAAEKNLDAVFNKYESGLLFASDRIDITHDVITRFNAGK